MFIKTNSDLHFPFVLSLFLAISSLTGCDGESEVNIEDMSNNPISNNTDEIVKEAKNVELPFVNYPIDIRYIERNGQAIYQGDIVLGTSDEVVSAKPSGHPQRPNFSALYDNESYGSIGTSISYLTAINSDEYLWENGIIPYRFSNEWNGNEINRIKDILTALDRETNLTLIPYNQHDDYIEFAMGDDGIGSSPVGRQGGKQVIKLGGIRDGHVVHEVLHSAGFYHEQSRPDRDSYVVINWDNIIDSKEHNFDLHPDSRPLGPYDYNSIMHYPETIFGDGRVTISAIDQSVTTVGGGNWLTDIDRDAINILYKEDRANLVTPLLSTLRTVEVTIRELEVKSGSDGCGNVEFYSRMEIGQGHEWVAGDATNNTLTYESRVHSDGAHIFPLWTHQGVVEKNATTAKAVIRVREEDDFLCGADDEADINPLNGSSGYALHLLIDLIEGNVFLWDPVDQVQSHFVGNAGSSQPIPLQGFQTRDNDGDEALPAFIKLDVKISE